MVERQDLAQKVARINRIELIHASVDYKEARAVGRREDTGNAGKRGGVFKRLAMAQQRELTLIADFVGRDLASLRDPHLPVASKGRHPEIARSDRHPAHYFTMTVGIVAYFIDYTFCTVDGQHPSIATHGESIGEQQLIVSVDKPLHSLELPFGSKLENLDDLRQSHAGIEISLSVDLRPIEYRHIAHIAQRSKRRYIAQRLATLDGIDITSVPGVGRSLLYIDMGR